MDRARLEARLERLEADLRKLEAQALRIQGAIALATELLKEADADPASGAPEDTQ